MNKIIKKRLPALLIAIVLVMSMFAGTAAPVLAEDEIPTYEENGIIYELYDDYAQVAGYTGTPTDLVIPKIVSGLNVTRIKNSAFEGCTSLTSVTLPDGLEYVGANVFKNCTSLVSASLPDTITTLGSYSFYGCRALESVNLPKGITEISYELFHSCSALKQITIPGNITSIAGYAFSNAGLTSVVFPEGLRTIGLYSFQYCSSLESVEFPDSLKTIGKAVFQYCHKLKKAVVPAGVTTMELGAFYYNDALESIEIRGKIKSLGNVTFDLCSSLKEVIIPEGVESIGWHTFRSMTALRKLYIPDSVTSIDAEAFTNTSNFKAYVHRGSYADSRFASYQKVYIDEEDYYAQKTDWMFARTPEITVGIDDTITADDLFLFGPDTDRSGLTLSSSDENVVMLTGEGFLLIDNGSAVITAHCGEKTAEVIVKVAPSGGAETGEVSFAEESVTADVGDAVYQQPVFAGDISKDYVVTWTSSDTEIATVDLDGIVHGVAEGTAEITAHCGLFTASYEFNAIRSAKQVDIWDDDITLNQGRIFRPLYYTYPYDSPEPTEFISSNTSVATVDETGLITATGPGVAVITLKKGDCTDSFTVTVTAHLEGVALDYSTLRMRKGMSVDLGFCTVPKNTTDPYEVTWESSDPSVVAVNDNGVVTGLSQGRATVTVTAGEYSASCVVMVLNMTGVEISASSAEIAEGESLQLSARAKPVVTEGTPDYLITWSSSDPETVSVDVNGLVTGLKIGNAVITAASEGYEATCAVTVKCAHTGATEVRGAIEPTCTEPGSTGDTYCLICGELIHEHEEITALGHTPAEAVRENEVAASCTAEGIYDEVVYCSVCHEELSREKHTTEALGHDYHGVVTAPTCEEKGYTTYTCTRCGDSYVADHTEALGHDYQITWEWAEDYSAADIIFTCSRDESHTEKYPADVTSVTVEPTYEEDGSITYTASYDRDGEHYEDVQIVVLPMLVARDIKDAVLSLDSDVTLTKGIYWSTYNGTLIRPELVVIYDDVKLQEGTDYSASYKSNKNVGTATITVTGIGDYTGNQEITFRICFKDVPFTHNFQSAVYWAVDEGIGAGYSGAKTGIFGVGDDITRGQVAMFLWRAAGKPEPQNSVQKFTDVPQSNNFFKAIQWAAEQGIAGGYTGARKGQFGPSDPCTRGQIAMFLWRAAGKHTPESTIQKFSDVPSSNNFFTAIQWAAENGITAGYSDGTFGVSKTCTRGHCVTFLYRMDQKGFLK